MREEIWDALESTAPNRNPKAKGFFHEGRETANARDTRLWRDSLMRFLDELDAETTVGEAREALDEWSATR